MVGVYLVLILLVRQTDRQTILLIHFGGSPREISNLADVASAPVTHYTTWVCSHFDQLHLSDKSLTWR